MATTTTKKKPAAKKVVTDTVAEEVITVDDSSAVEETVATPKKFNNNEFVDCVSITTGELYFEGPRTKNLYVWADLGDVIGVEYQDLVYAVRSRNPIMMKPRFIVQDDDFLSQNPSLESLYNGMYTDRDLRDILHKKTSNEMMAEIINLPSGAKDAIKSIASDMIRSGRLDSVQKIRALDEYFETNLLMLLTSR